MKTLASLLLPIFSIITICCSNDTTNPSDTYSVSGKVFSRGYPVENAQVIIDDFTNLQNLTDSAGSFKIFNVPKGGHSLKVSKYSEDGSFGERTSSISVEGDVIIDHLILPTPVILYDVENITENSVDIKWSESDASDFREYKVYKHDNPGLDESTGELIYVATTKSDTSYTVPNLNPLSEYFFRVYVMNDFGRLGGSNIVSAQTQNREIISNGSFENLNLETGYPVDWRAYNSTTGYYFVDSTIKQEGNLSIRIENAPGVNYYYQLVAPQFLVPFTHYKLSYWIKHDALASGDEFAVFINTIEFNWHIIANQVQGPRLASDWELYEYDFFAPDVSTTNFSFGFYFYIEGGKKAWLDNVSLKKVL